MRVLVVDDDKLVAVSLKTILEADGEITVVGLGEAGDDAIRLYFLGKILNGLFVPAEPL